MKILSNIVWIALLACGFMFTGCEDDPVFLKAEDAEFEVKGALPTVSDVRTGFFDFADPASASVGFVLDAVGESVNSIKVFKSYSGVNGDLGPIEHAVVSGLPADLNVTLDEALNGFNITADDLAIGDVFTLSFESTASSGVYGSGTSIAIPVSCVSALEGTYSAVSTGMSTDGCCPGELTVESEVVLTSDGGGNYTISDWSGGVYIGWYGPAYGLTAGDVTDAVQISDVCNVLSAAFTEPYGTAASITGSVDTATGVITFSWVTGYDDVGTVVMTPQ